MDSQALAAESLEIARVLVNLGHSYLRTTNVESPDDEEEEEEEEHRKAENDQQDGLENNLETLIEDEFAGNVEHNFEEEMQVQVDDKLQQVDYEKQFEIDNECTENVYNKSGLSEKKIKDFKDENVKKCKNKNILTKFDSERPNKIHESEETESVTEMQVNEEFDKNIPELFVKNQQMGESYVEIKLDIEVDSDFEQESSENMFEENCSEKQLSDEDIYVSLNIELPDNTDDMGSLQLLDTSAILEEQQNCEDDNKTELEKVIQKFKKKLLQTFDSEKQPDHAELDSSNMIIEDNKVHQHEKQDKKELEKNLNHSGEKQIIIPTIQQSFDNEMLVSLDNIDNEKLDEKEQSKFKENQQIFGNTQQYFDKEKLFECNEKVQEQLDKQNKNVDEDVPKEYSDKCKDNVLNNDELQNVECEFNMEVQVNSKIQLQSREQHNNENQSMNEYESHKIIGEQVERTVNSDIQVDDNNSQTVCGDQSNVQDVAQVQKNREPKKDIKTNQIYFSDKIQEQLNKETEQELNNDIQINFKSKIGLLELELEPEKKIEKELNEKFQNNTKKNIGGLSTELFDCRQNVVDVPPQSENKETHEHVIGQIQQEIEVLKIKAKEFDYDQDEESDRIINEKINKTYSYLGEVNFIKNLQLLFKQQSSSAHNRLNTLCNQLFPELNYEQLTDSTNIIEDILNVNVVPEADRIFKQNTCKAESQTFISVTGHDDTIQVVKEDVQSECNENNKEKIPINLVDINNEENKEKIIEDIIEIPQETVHEHFDVVVTFNSVHQKDNVIPQAVSEEVQIQFNKDMLKKFQEDDQLNVCENLQQSSDKQLSLLVQEQELDEKNVQDIEVNAQLQFYEDTQLEVDEKEFNLSEDIHDDIKNQHLNKNIEEKLNLGTDNSVHLQLEFFSRSDVEGDFQENSIENKRFIESFKKKLFHSSKNITPESGEKMDHFEGELEELLDESNLSSNEFEETLHERNLEFEESDIDVEGLDDDEEQFDTNVSEDNEEVQDESEVNIVSNSESDESSEDSYVDIEEFEDEIPGSLNEEVQRMPEEVEITNMVHANFERSVKNNSKLNVEKSFKEVNEVVELVEDIEIKSNLSVSNITNTNNECSLLDKLFSEDNYSEKSSSSDKSSFSEGSSFDINPCVLNYSSSEESSSESSLINKLNSTCLESSSSDSELSYREELFGSEEEFSSTDNEDFSGELEDNKIVGVQKFASDEIYKEVHDQDFGEGPSSKSYGKSLQDVKSKWHELKNQSKLGEKYGQTLEDLQLKMDLLNIQHLDEIPLELKIQQEQFEEDLHKQFKGFQKEFYEGLKSEYDKKLQLKDKYGSNSESSQAFDEQQKTFCKLKTEFQDLRQEYESFVQQKVFDELEGDIDDKTLLNVDNCLEKFNNVINVVDEGTHKEFVELKRACYELEPEFKYNVPLDFEEENLCENLKPKPYNLLERLYCKHRQKLCEFADANTWPEYCLYPSSLLDQLFDDPLEFKPNVIVITLYSIDIGYSVKLTMKKNNPPIETIFNYAEDSVLDFVEQGELPPVLLETLDRAEPRVFYNGCVIAEIHNKFKDVLDGVYRVLLRPSNLSILCDVERLIAENSHINWTYNRRLKLESTLLKACNPSLCLETSPIAGLAVQLQHQMLSARTFVLNPLKCKRLSSKFKSSMKALSDNLLPSETQSDSSKLMNVASDSEVHRIIWKFEFRLKSKKLMKLFVLRTTETQEYSMFLCLNSNNSAMDIRFKVNLETNTLSSYISVILDIFKEKISSDMLVVRKYKNDGRSEDLFLSCVPTLFSDNIYNPSHADINQLINKLFEHNSKHQFFKTDLENKNVESLLTPSQLYNILQKTEKTNQSSLKEHEHSFKETKQNILSPNIEISRGVKRKRTTS